MNSFEVVCIDDTNRPHKIPVEQWVKYGKDYTVEKLVKMNLQPGVFGYFLKEVQIDPVACAPYSPYSSKRFVSKEEFVLMNKEVVEETLELEIA